MVEGIAELYSLELLVRSKTVSRRRYEKALWRLAARGKNVRFLDVESASGDVTARAVVVLRELDRQIEKASDGEAGLDEAVARLAAQREPISVEQLRGAAEAAAGGDLGDFFETRVPQRPASR